MEKLYFLRHGEAKSNVEGHTGGYATGLTDEGKAQAQKISGLIAEHKIDKIVTSNMLRAQQTAIRVKEGIESPIPIERDHRLQEISLGKNNNTPYSELPKDFVTNAKEYSAETLQDVYTRASHVMNDLKKDSSGNILVVAHGLILEALTYCACNDKLDKEKFREHLTGMGNVAFGVIDMGLPQAERKVELISNEYGQDKDKQRAKMMPAVDALPERKPNKKVDPNLR